MWGQDHCPVRRADRTVCGPSPICSVSQLSRQGRQAWAIYGYVNSARETGKLAYLHLAERLAEYYWKRLDRRQAPPYDFDAIGSDVQIMDTAAAAIVSSALIELARLHPLAEAATKWRGRGVAMREALCRDELTDADQHGLVHNSCYSRPHNIGVNGATMFGDFYFVEAVCRIVHPGKLRPLDAPHPLLG